MYKILPTPANLPQSRAMVPVCFLASSGLSSPVLASQYFHTARCVLPARTETNSSVGRISLAVQHCGLVMWIAYGQVWSQTMEVFRVVSTLPTATHVITQIAQSYTQFCMQLTVLLSTVKKRSITSVKLYDIHIVHPAYYYNYINI